MKNFPLKFLIFVEVLILFSASACAKSENVIWRELWEGITDPTLYFFGNLAQRVILVYGAISKEITDLLIWNSNNIRYYLLMNPILDDPAFLGVITYFIRILEPVYVVSILILGIYLIFFSVSPGGRSIAKSGMQRLILGMVLVSISIEIIRIISRISSSLTSGILSMGPSNLMDSYTVASLYLLRKIQELMVVDISIAAPFMFLAILLSSGIFLLLIARYFLVISLSVLLPIAISFYLLNPTKSMGNIILRQLFFWIFLPVIYALTLVTIAVGENSIGMNIPELRDMHLLSGALSILLSPLVMYYVTNWASHLVAVSHLPTVYSAGMSKTRIGDAGIVIYPEIISVYIEKSTKIELTIKNTGEKPLNIVKINDTGLSDKNIKLTYSKRGFTIEKYGEMVITIEISAGEDVIEGAYSGSFVVTTSDGITATARILINVKPKEALMWGIILKEGSSAVASRILKKKKPTEEIVVEPKIIIHPKTLRERVSSYLRPIIMQKREKAKISVGLGVFGVVPPVVHSVISPSGTTKIEIVVRNDSGREMSGITLYNIDIPEAIVLKYSLDRFTLKKDEEKTVTIEILTKEDIVEKSYPGNIMISSAEGITAKVRLLVDVKRKETLEGIQISPEVINVALTSGKSTKIELTIKNTGEKPLNIVKINDTGLSDKNIKLIYSKRGFTIEKYGEMVMAIEILPADDVMEGTYSGSFVITTSDGLTAVTKILVDVKPGKAEMWEILRKEGKLPEREISQVKIKHEEIISPITQQRIRPTERREEIILEKITKKEIPEEIKEEKEEISLEEIKPPELPRFTLAPLTKPKPTKPVSIP